MRRFSRIGLVTMLSVVLVSIGIGVGVLVADGGSGSDEAKVTIDKPVAFDGERPMVTSDEERTKAGAEGFKRESYKLAAELISPQNLANTFYIANAITAVDPTP